MFFVKELKNCGLILTRCKRFFSSPKYWDKLQDSSSLLFSRYRSLFPQEQSRQGIQLTAHLHTVQIMWWTKRGGILYKRRINLVTTCAYWLYYLVMGYAFTRIWVTTICHFLLATIPY